MDLLRPFTEHPGSVGESYLQHQRKALSFSIRMISGGLACLVHAFLPFLFVRTGSDCVQLLNDRMGARRSQQRVPEAFLAQTPRVAP